MLILNTATNRYLLHSALARSTPHMHEAHDFSPIQAERRVRHNPELKAVFRPCPIHTHEKTTLAYLCRAAGIKYDAFLGTHLQPRTTNTTNTTNS